MYLERSTLDDLLYEILTTLVNGPFSVHSSRGDTNEIIGVLINLKNPRARLSRSETKGTVFSALGELIWYLSGSNELSQIYHYIRRYENDAELDGTIYGAYGPRLYHMHGEINQIENTLHLLKKRPTTRRAVIQFFDARDLNSDRKEIPCTCSLQFLIREGKLYLNTYMRSNDAFWGLPHDVFAFTMLQEIFARSLSVELGEYYHHVGSLHLYHTQASHAKSYLSEGFQSTTKPMPEMPLGNPWSSVNELVQLEEKVRLGEQANSSQLEDYWADLVRLLEIYANRKKTDLALGIAQRMKSDVYDSHIKKKIEDNKW